MRPHERGGSLQFDCEHSPGQRWRPPASVIEAARRSEFSVTRSEANARPPGDRSNPAARPRYAEALLRDCGHPHNRPAARPGGDPAFAWARSGAMALTGWQGGPPLLAPGPLAECADEALRALRCLAPTPSLEGLDGAALLGERAATAGLERHGRIAPGGACRLLATRDGWLAVNLAREDDRALLPAWLEADGFEGPDAWQPLADTLAERSAAPLLERARWMGLPVAEAKPPSAHRTSWLHRTHGRPLAPRPASALPVVLDLSSLWAGPLCTHLLQLAGARVIKVESSKRPDGARRGPRDFYDLLNADKESLALDLAASEDRHRLMRLIERVDVVVESSRPRALRQLGIDAEALTRSRPGLSWLSITGYGRTTPRADWVAFGDDAAAAAGVAALTGGPGDRPLFCGDAIADPLTGLHAAVATLAAHRAGGGVLLDVSLHDVTAHALDWDAGHSPNDGARVEACGPAGRESNGESISNPKGRPKGKPTDEWQLRIGGRCEPVRPPRARPVTARARDLGADTPRLLRELLGE